MYNKAYVWLQEIDTFCGKIQGEQLKRMTDYVKDDIRLVKMQIDGRAEVRTQFESIKLLRFILNVY